MSDEQPSSQLLQNVDEDRFVAELGITKFQAARVTGAALAVIGAAMPDNLTPQQQGTNAINIAGFIASEIIAGTSQDSEAATGQIKLLTGFIERHVAEQLRQREAAQQFAKLITDTTNENGDTVKPEGLVVQ